MIMIETISGALWCKPEQIKSFFTDKGDYYVILEKNGVSQKWRITRNAFLKLAAR